MTIIRVLLFFIFCAYFLNASADMDSVNIYIHNKTESFQSKIIKFGMSVAGMKNYIEKTIERNNFNHKPADIPKSLGRKFEISEKSVLKNTVYIIRPKANVSEKTIIYLHGGAYIESISKIHWDFIEELLNRTNATIFVPLYPLVPNANYSDVYAFVDAVYQLVLSDNSNDNIIIIGDSAGGGLALGYVQKLRNESALMPKQLILISPWLDITMSNPDIVEIEKKDKMLNINGLKMAGELYADHIEHDNFLVSPIYGNFNGLPEISIFTGTHDILYPDAKKLKKIIMASDTKLNYFEYPKMFHVWVLITSLKESRHAISQIVDAMNVLN